MSKLSKQYLKDNWKTYFFTILYPNSIIIAYENHGIRRALKSFIVTYLLSEEYFKFLSFGMVVSIFFVPGLIFWLNKNVLEEQLEGLKEEVEKIKNKKNNLILLMSKLDEVVKLKKDRCFRLYKQKEIVHGDILFDQITQPSLQMENLLTACLTTFTSVYCDETLHGSLFRCAKRKNTVICIEDCAIISENHRRNLRAINNRRSLAYTVLNTDASDILIRENCDDSEEASPFVPEKSRIKSLLCFAIRDSEGPKYLLNISSLRNGAFLHSRREEYEAILRRIESRVLLEEYLYCLKSRTQANNQPRGKNEVTTKV